MIAIAAGRFRDICLIAKAYWHNVRRRGFYYGVQLSFDRSKLLTGYNSIIPTVRQNVR